MSLWCAMVGEIVVKEEFRKDFGHLFRGEYDEILREGPIAEYVKDHGKSYLDDMLSLDEWSHDDYKEEWKGKYETSYDEETGRFTYGVAYNEHGEHMLAMLDMKGLLMEIEEEEVSRDHYDEGELTKG